jgi:hypothetical protein
VDATYPVTWESCPSAQVRAGGAVPVFTGLTLLNNAVFRSSVKAVPSTLEITFGLKPNRAVFPENDYVSISLGWVNSGQTTTFKCTLSSYVIKPLNVVDQRNSFVWRKITLSGSTLNIYAGTTFAI